MTSTNGSAWRVLRANLPNDLYGMAYGQGTFVAVGTGASLVSTDGEVWRETDRGTTDSLFNVAYGGGVFVAVGGNGTIVSSTNGSDWVLRYTFLTRNWYGLTYAHGRFVAAGAWEGIALSSDGVNWSIHPAECRDQGAVTFFDGRFFAAGSYTVVIGNETRFPRGLLSSADGINWARQTPGRGRIVSFASGNGVLVSVEDLVDRGGFSISVNGTNWVPLTTPLSPDVLNGVAFGNDCFVAVGDAGALYRSPDGTNWASQRIGATATIGGGVYTQDGFVLVSERPNSILKSPDGENWSFQDLGVNLTCIAYGPNCYVAGGEGGKIFTSTNASVWEESASPAAESISQVCYGNGVFVAFSRDKLLRSTNGMDWEGREGSIYTRSLSFGNGLFVLGGGVLGFTGLATSPDGLAWTYPLSGTTNAELGTVYRVTFGNNTFLVDAGQLMSRDGIHWNRRPEGGSMVISTSFGEGTFIGIQDGQVATSKDGVSWVKHPAAMHWVDGFLAGNNTFLAFGVKGRIARSAPLDRVLSIHSNRAERHLQLDGIPQFGYLLQQSGNLQEWKDVATVTNLQSALKVPLTISPEAGSSFFRARRLTGAEDPHAATIRTQSRPLLH